MKRVEKILGADVELGNVLQRPVHGADANERAARLLLDEIDGVPDHTAHGLAYAPGDCCYSGRTSAGAALWQSAAHDPQDWGRKYLDSNGACFYIDMGHVEACIPEVRSAHCFVAAHHANLRIARAACTRANAKLGTGERIVVLANNSDRMGNSFGGHLNVLVSRDLWTQTFDRMYPTLFVLAAFQVSSIVYTGQGKVGSENGRPWVPFQLSQRGDFFECLAALQTTHHRPICNTRDEAHVGNGTAGSDLARCHIIFFDTSLTPVSNYLKSGVTQVILAMLEAGWCDTGTVLEDPLAALIHWGHDPGLRAVAQTFDGRRMTAVEHQWMFARAARRFVEAGEALDYVPEAERIVGLWEDTLEKLERRDFTALSGRLDWVMKRTLIERMIARDPGLDWRSPEIRAADLLFANLDKDTGPYWALEAAGGVERIVTEGEILRAMREPPEDTRAWPRTMLLRQAGRSGIESVNWDLIRLRPGSLSATSDSIRFDDPRCAAWSDMQCAGEPAAGGSAFPAPEPLAQLPEKGQQS